jgi:hypothetical protein
MLAGYIFVSVYNVLSTGIETVVIVPLLQFCPEFLV